MIQGRILMTEERLQKIVVEMIAYGSRERAHAHLYDEVSWHANIWHFGPKDKQLLADEIAHRYDIYAQLFDKPPETPNV